MKPLAIKEYPDKVLRKQCSSVEEVTEKEKQLLNKMIFTMHFFRGIGLAASQIGIAQRLIIADIGEGILQLANPKIITIKGMDSMQESCLSIPQASVNIERPYQIVVIGLNEKGEKIEHKTEGLLARVLQHEIDHLNGKLIIDYMSAVKFQR